MSENVSIDGSARLLNAQSQIDSLLESNKTYEAVHLIFTLSNRFASKKNFVLAQKIAFDGASSLLMKGETRQGAQIAHHYLDVLEKSGSPPEGPHIQKLLGDFPPTAPTDLVVNFLKASIASDKRTRSGSKLQEGQPSDVLSHLLANFLARKKLFAKSHSHFLHSNTPTEHVRVVLVKWAELGQPEEKPLFFVRAVLQYMALEKYKAARTVLSNFQKLYQEDKDTVNHPLIHFVDSLLEAQGWPQDDRVTVFRGLLSKYEAALSWDPELMPLLDKIGQKCFKIEPPKSFLESLFSEDGMGAAFASLQSGLAAEMSAGATGRGQANSQDADDDNFGVD